MNVREIVISHLKSIGADGLCAYECGCGLDDLMPCDSPNIEKCVPAKRHDCDGTCGGCDGIPGDCFRPVQIQLEDEEEIHL